MTLACFSFVGYCPIVTDIFIISARGFDKMCLAKHKILVGQEYNPCALFGEMETISRAVTGLEKERLAVIT